MNSEFRLLCFAVLLLVEWRFQSCNAHEAVTNSVVSPVTTISSNQRLNLEMADEKETNRLLSLRNSAACIVKCRFVFLQGTRTKEYRVEFKSLVSGVCSQGSHLKLVVTAGGRRHSQLISKDWLLFLIESHEPSETSGKWLIVSDRGHDQLVLFEATPESVQLVTREHNSNGVRSRHSLFERGLPPAPICHFRTLVAVERWIPSTPVRRPPAGVGHDAPFFSQCWATNVSTN
jgi:hypothetical protein